MRLILAEEPTVQFSEVAQLFIATFNRPSYAESEKTIAKTQGKTQGKIVELLRGDHPCGSVVSLSFLCNPVRKCVCNEPVSEQYG
jgi:hypothetical protein